MSSLSDDPLIDDYTHNILEQIMKTEEGKMIVRQIKGQIKEISDTYKFLKDDNKEELEILRNKIRESIEQLKENMDAAHQYTDFGFLAVLAVLVSLVFFC